ncbi:MAG: LacI family DNA-binding transcriptional regulator [Clostridiales bacterium]|nr:LacI family DNA-binding transcriptional regulator [Clostridiales bacterium]MDY5514445.1 LacI family DNA-binding transcriptional regulator [Candidatus Ventricola sp.]
MPDKQVTIYDVAQTAGVSIATVSRVMSGGSVSAASRQKVEAAIEALGYSPSPSATHRTAKRDGRRLAMVLSEISNPYFASMAAGAEKEARRNGYALLLYTVNLKNGDAEGIIDRLIEQRPDGAVLVGSILENKNACSLQSLLRLQRAMPLVTIGPRIEELSSINITSDLSLSVRKSINHLYALGHRRIAFIGGTSDVRSSSIREKAFYDEMERLDLHADRTLHTETGYMPQDGEICVAKLFARLSPGELPTALIAINDLVALGAMRQLQRMGLRVPDDVAIIGCDNQFFTSYLNPPLTTVDLHPEEHGRSAVSELILAGSGGSIVPYSQISECTLIVRESCGAALGYRRLG